MTSSLAEALYPDCQYTVSASSYEGRTYFDSPCDYTPIIQYFGHIIVEIEERGYQGDTFVLLGKDDRYGLLIFGWGSCSGCDALQACKNYEQIDTLITELENQIFWFDTFQDAQSFINDDLLRRSSFYYHTSTWSEFKAAVNRLAPS